jgi:DNA-binding transcriptional LysR family regulator
MKTTLEELLAFRTVVDTGSVTAAAEQLGQTVSGVSRALRRLEEKLDTTLLSRTTRRLSLTDEGATFLAQARRILAAVDEAEEQIALRRQQPAGRLRVNAAMPFMLHVVAPLVPDFLARHPDVSVSLNLSDRVVDIVNEGFDCAVRVGDLPDSSLVSVRLADNRRLCVATPAYLARAGTPQHPSELLRHECLTLSSDASQTRGWAFRVDGQVQHLRPTGRLDCSDGQVLHDWCRRGLGLAWRSTWEVVDDIRSGQLVSVLDDFAAPPNGIFAVVSQRKHLPLRVRLWIDFLKEHYAQPRYWEGSAPDAPASSSFTENA